MYLYQRNHSYYFRMRITATFSLHFGITEVRHALKIKNKRTEQRLAIFLYNRMDIIFAKFIQKGLDVSITPKITNIDQA